MAAIPMMPAAMMGPGGMDPRNDVSTHQQEMQMTDNDLIDGDINQQPLEVYMYYAAIERQRELEAPEGDSPYGRLFRKTTGKGQSTDQAPSSSPPLEGGNAFGESEKEKDGKEGQPGTMITERSVSRISGSERENAYRALRTASWQGVFFLITTDILGPSSAPAALASLGYGGGVLVYSAFFFLAVIAGQALWRLYCRMDSSRFPVKNYSDIGERLIGRWFRHVCNIVQSLQLFLNVGILILGNGQTLATIINYKFCFVALNVFFTIFGAGMGQIKSLRNFSWIANMNIWLNIVTIILAIVGCSVYAPVPTLNFPDLTAPFPPVTHSAFAPNGTGWYTQINGVIYAVFAYGGAMIFVEFMAEMRKPHSFWKAALGAQTFIYLCYLLYGLIIYHAQGQYSYIIPTLSIANAGMQIASNVFAIVTAQIALVLYGNIGIKVLYFNVLQAYFKAPELSSKGGKRLWPLVVVVYYAVAFIIASAVPNISSLIVLVGAVCILQFTYTFPPILWVAYLVHIDAMEGEAEWQPGMVVNSNRIDTWKDMSRWKRGFRKNMAFKGLLIFAFIGSMVLCGLGAYAGVEGIIATFAATGHAPSFSCRAPGQPA